MDTSSFIAVAAFAVFFNALLLYIVISSATKARKRSLYEWAQLDLLSKIARVQGVPAEEISRTLEVAGLVKAKPIPVTNPFPQMKN